MVKIAPDDTDAAVTEEDFPGKNQRADSKGNVVFLCIYFFKKEGGGVHKNIPACSPTHNLLLHDVPLAAFLFLEQIMFQTETLWGTVL